MLIGVLSGVTGGVRAVRSDNNFELALKLPVNVASLVLGSLAATLAIALFFVVVVVILLFLLDFQFFVFKN